MPVTFYILHLYQAYLCRNDNSVIIYSPSCHSCQQFCSHWLSFCFLYTVEVIGSCVVANILQNIFSVLQIKESHTGMGENKRWPNFHFWVVYPLKMFSRYQPASFCPSPDFFFTPTEGWGVSEFGDGLRAWKRVPSGQTLQQSQAESAHGLCEGNIC